MKIASWWIGRHSPGMGFHCEESEILGGSIDSRMKGKTILKVDFVNHTSSLITLQGNPFRDLAGSLWKFTNPFAKMEDIPGEQCYFIPALCEGTIGRVTYSRKQKVPVIPPDEYLETIFTPEHDKVEMKVSPVLDLEWFTPKFGQVEIDCERMTVELVEMVWSLSAEEAAEGEDLAEQVRMEHMVEGEDLEGHIERIEGYIDHDPEPHEIEEKCFLIVQEFVINSADDSEEKKELHGDLIKLQEQMAGAFVHYDDEEDTFDDVSRTITLLNGVLPFIDRAAVSAQFVAETTSVLLEGLRESVVALRDELREE